MTDYDIALTSLEDSEPDKLYKFAYGGQAITLTSGDEEVEYLGEIYEPATVSNSAAANTSDANLGSTKVSFAGVQALIDLFRDEPPGEIVTLTVFRRERSVAGEFRVSWMGEIHGFSIENGEMILQADSALGSQMRMGLSPTWSKSCPHTLYDSATCKVNRNTFAVAGTISALGVSSITVPDFNALLTLKAGYIEYDDPLTGVKARRTISGHSGSVLSLTSAPRNLSVGDSVVAYPNCDHTRGALGCARFGNILNHGGCPGLPVTNPYSPSTLPF